MHDFRLIELSFYQYLGHAFAVPRLLLFPTGKYTKRDVAVGSIHLNT